MIPAGASVCECGYSFETNRNDTAVIAETLSTEEEELFVAYLVARVDQARESLEAQRAELASHPRDFAKAMEVMKAVHELRDARNVLDAQLAQLPEGSSLKTAVSAKPSEEFRTQQAAHAAKIMETIQAAIRRAPPPFHGGNASSGKPSPDLTPDTHGK
jgi:hypothetical protein